MKTEWTDAQLDEIEAAMIAEGHLEIEVATVRGRLTARKLRDDCPVMYDLPRGVPGILTYGPFTIPSTATNVRPLITVEEARKIARRAVMSHGTWSAEQLDSILSGIDRDLDEYQYGPTDE